MSPGPATAPAEGGRETAEVRSPTAGGEAEQGSRTPPPARPDVDARHTGGPRWLGVRGTPASPAAAQELPGWPPPCPPKPIPAGSPRARVVRCVQRVPVELCPPTPSLGFPWSSGPGALREGLNSSPGVLVCPSCQRCERAVGAGSPAQGLSVRPGCVSVGLSVCPAVPRGVRQPGARPAGRWWWWVPPESAGVRRWCGSRRRAGADADWAAAPGAGGILVLSWSRSCPGARTSRSPGAAAVRVGVPVGISVPVRMGVPVPAPPVR